MYLNTMAVIFAQHRSWLYSIYLKTYTIMIMEIRCYVICFGEFERHFRRFSSGSSYFASYVFVTLFLAEYKGVPLNQMWRDETSEDVPLRLMHRSWLLSVYIFHGNVCIYPSNDNVICIRNVKLRFNASFVNRRN